MSSKLTVEELLANLEQRAVFHQDQEAFHAQQEVHHREQRALHAAELEKVKQNLEVFRPVAAAAADLARPIEPKAAPAAAEIELPPPGRLQVSQLLRQIIESPGLEEPFGPTALAAEANRRFAGHLKKTVDPRAALDVLRRLLAEEEIELAREGKAFHEALYTRKTSRHRAR